jgi:transposase
LAQLLGRKENDMPAKIFLVTLNEEEREHLHAVLRAKISSAERRLRAQILLKADETPGAPAWNDERIAETFGCATRTVVRLRRRCVEEGAIAAIERKPQRNRFRKVDGKVEAHLVAQACGKPPEGRATWTLQLLADRLVELRVVDSVSYETVRRTLKKTNSSLG